MFTGKEFDAESGLLHYEHRYYDPKDGRFISQDPSGLGPDANAYRYVGNDPIDLTDPTGLSAQQVFTLSSSTSLLNPIVGFSGSYLGSVAEGPSLSGSG